MYESRTLIIVPPLTPHPPPFSTAHLLLFLVDAVLSLGLAGAAQAAKPAFQESLGGKSCFCGCTLVGSSIPRKISN